MSIERHFNGSRKWAAAMIGIGCMGAVYASGLTALVLCDAGKAQHVVSLANIAIVFLGGITGTLVTGQSLVDWRHGSANQSISGDRLEKRETVVRNYAPKHYDDEAVS
ncbi:MAG: hypothetical protein WCP06_03040 [Verrucomicrobiota bacterium]